MSIAKRIKDLRIEKGWTQKYLSDLSGVVTPVINRMEKGVVKNTKHLPAVAATLGVTEAYLRFGDETQRKEDIKLHLSPKVQAFAIKLQKLTPEARELFFGVLEGSGTVRSVKTQKTEQKNVRKRKAA